MVNYWAILLCVVLSMVLGFVWYGPLFGRKWMRLTGVDPDNVEQCKEMQKKAMLLYGIQIVLSLVQVVILNNLIVWTGASDKAVWVAFFMWLGFVMPTVAGASMWTSQSAKDKWTTFLISASYQLVSLLVFGLTLGMWR